ncbi:MAG: hypothetical protein SAK29_41440 [Scytonema sp. PMC 1069.18]|nr:hypothetical protein [Scytonema sp. PMC 1069.18]MEC4884877.1 hypothetical protein [Scytonema sp. PMC 1070.18]
MLFAESAIALEVLSMSVKERYLNEPHTLSEIHARVLVDVARSIAPLETILSF